jgi:hypothetical protein
MSVLSDRVSLLLLQTFGTNKPENGLNERVPGYRNDDFQTLGWRYWVDDQKPGKTLVNLRKVQSKDILSEPSVHRPFDKAGPICQGPVFMSEQDSVFVVNHYPGTLEQMLFRVHDSRGTSTNATEYRTKRFEGLKQIKENLETELVQEWLPGFIDSVGKEEAEALLKYVGNPCLASGLNVCPPMEMQQSVRVERNDNGEEIQGFPVKPSPPSE